MNFKIRFNFLCIMHQGYGWDAALCLSGHRGSLCRKLPGQQDRCRQCRFVVREDGSWQWSRGVPASDRKPAAWCGDSAREWGISDWHQQPTPDYSWEDVNGHHRCHQPGTDQCFVACMCSEDCLANLLFIVVLLYVELSACIEMKR